MPAPPAAAFTIPLHDGRKLTPQQWTHIEQLLEDWKREVLAAARKHPARSFRLGQAQVEAFADLLSGLNRAAPHASAFGGESPSMIHAARWAETYTLHELDDALNVYVGRIKDALMYGLRGAINPTDIARHMYKATEDATINWRMIARTEMVRANAAGRLRACAEMGYDRVWCPPHIGSCKHCKRLVEGQHFAIAEVIDATNFGRPVSEWVATIPVHPNCRHSWLPYDPDVYEDAMRQYRAMEAAGLTDEDRLDQMFDSSGQLKPEYADVDFSAAKMLDPYAEGLAAVIAKRASVPASATTRQVTLDTLRVDLYQRALDPLKVADLTRKLLTRRILPHDLPPLKVSHRPDGTLWLIGGQHRAEALRLAGFRTHPAVVHHGLSWEQESELCRAAIAKVYQSARTVRGLEQGEEALGLEPFDPVPLLLSGHSDTVRPAHTHADVGKDGDDGTALDSTLWDGLRLRDDVDMAITGWWQQTAGDQWENWSQVLVDRRGPLTVLVDYPQLRQARPEWRKLSDTDLHMALVATARRHRGAEVAPGLPLDLRIVPAHYAADDPIPALASGWHLNDSEWYGERPDHRLAVDAHKVYPDLTWTSGAPGPLPMDLADRLSETVSKRATVIHQLGFRAGRKPGEWGQGLVTPDGEVHTWPEGEHTHAGKARELGHRPEDCGKFAVRHDGWTKFYGEHTRPEHADHVTRSSPGFWTTGASHDSEPTEQLHKTGPDVDVLKAAKAAATDAGTEHWITVHPHGEGTKGQPVLVRNNRDGTMTVVGGAGGNLNYLRLDPSRRVDRDAGGKAKGAKKVEQAVHQEESAEQIAQREQEVATAQAGLEQAKELRAQKTAELHGYIKDTLGIDLHGEDMDSRARTKLIQKIKTSALRTLSYGEVSRRDANEGASAAELKREQDPDKTDGSDPTEPGTGTPRPQIGMSAEDAAGLLDHFGDLSQIGKIASQHRRVLGGDNAPSDANQIDWSLGGQEGRDERRAKAVEQAIRTDLARSALEHVDQQWKADGKKARYDLQFRQAHAQGSYDSIDAFSHAILGKSVISKAGHDLLGVAGSAQLIAHELQQRIKNEGLPLDKVQAALQELTDERERAVSEEALQRMRDNADRAVEAVRELGESKQGNSLYTTTMARSLLSKKTQEVKRGLGMMVGGLEAASALKTSLDREVGQIKVGFKTPSDAHKAAAKAGVKLKAGDLKRLGSGQYVLTLHPDRLTGLIREAPPVDKEYRQRLENIRTGHDLDAAIDDARTGPGMSDTLDRNQAKGKMFLQTAGSGLLAFDPGVGKTHTAIAAAMEKMHAEPDAGHRALIVAPTNMLRSWAATINAQGALAPDGTPIRVQVIGQSDANPEKDGGDKVKHFNRDAHFTIVSYETLKSGSMRKAMRDAHGDGRSHSIVIGDELQKAKNENTDNFAGVAQAVGHAADHHGERASFWGLTGTPIEKSITDLHSMRQLVARAKGTELPDRATVQREAGDIGQHAHIARGDKVRQFRKGLDEDLFRLSAQDAGNALPDPERKQHKVKLDADHHAHLTEKVGQLNEQIADYHERKKLGLSGGSMPQFGGHAVLQDALYHYGSEHGGQGNSLIRKTADIVDSLGTFKFGGMPSSPDGATYSKGDHAGEYEHKAVVFGASGNSQALFGKNPDGKGFAKQGGGGLHAELQRRGVKVFIGHGSMSSSENEANYKAFLAHKGKAVFLTNDKNNAGISLQFGDNRGSFQHGATHMIHFTQPPNNATIQQREARILRKGAAAKCTYHEVSADTPVERKLKETLESEKRTQDLAANSEQQVAGSDTLAHHLRREGIDPDRKT